MSAIFGPFQLRGLIARPYIEKKDGAIKCAASFLSFSQMRGAMFAQFRAIGAIACDVEVAP